MDTLLPIPTSQSPIDVRLVAAWIPCGFPSPAEDHAVERIDLNKILVGQPVATFVFRARGCSMSGVGIDDGDYVIVDRSLEPRSGGAVLAVVDGEFTLKILERRGRRVRLVAANPTYPAIELRDGQQLEIWGVVTWTLKPHRTVAASR